MGRQKSWVTMTRTDSTMEKLKMMGLLRMMETGLETRMKMGSSLQTG
jgi:hypothetical protein